MVSNIMSVIVAAANSYEESKKQADFVCGGKNDELTIQKALEKCDRENKRLQLLNGMYHIDGFYDFDDSGDRTAILIPRKWKEISIIGQNHEYGFQKNIDNGVVLYVSAEALDSVGSQGADVLRGEWTRAGIQNGASLRMENIAVMLADNRRKIRCIDLRRTDRAELKNITLVSYADDILKKGTGLDNPPGMPAEGCIGLTMTDGSNNSYSNYVNVQTYGFDEGIQVGGEHVVLINCGCAMGNYGFTFGNYHSSCGSNHPITLINCMDERNVNMPLFNRCGDDSKNGRWMQGRQEVTFINFNMERVEHKTPTGKHGSFMREVHPGTWRGRMEITIQPDWNALNSTCCQIWENDGSGSGIKTVNSAHKSMCGTGERMSYYPTLGQQIFDTDLNKPVICVDPQKRKWVDFNGNPV